MDVEGVENDPEKIEAIQNIPMPRSVKEIRSFLGMASYYWRFIFGFAGISAPLQAATSKNKKFEWDEEKNEAFEFLKDVLMTPPVLAFPDIASPLVVETDALAFSVGAVLEQKKEDGNINLVEYASRTMTATERRYTAYER